jgi:hypothetical protein
MIANASFSFVSVPKPMVPRIRFETEMPEFPSLRYFMFDVLEFDTVVGPSTFDGEDA